MSKRDRRRGPRHGQHVSPVTEKRRAAHILTGREVAEAKRLRDADWSFEAIAHELDRPVRDVELALQLTRSPNPANPNASIYSTRETVDRFWEQGLPGETAHQILVRLLEEHAHFQRMILG